MEDATAFARVAGLSRRTAAVQHPVDACSITAFVDKEALAASVAMAMRSPIVSKEGSSFWATWKTLRPARVVNAALLRFQAFCCLWQKRDSAQPGTLQRIAEEQLSQQVTGSEWAGFVRSSSLSYQPLLPPTAWLVCKDRGISNLARTSSHRKAEQLCASLEGATVVEKFPTVTELQIFCGGGQAPVPPLVRWKSAQ